MDKTGPALESVLHLQMLAVGAVDLTGEQQRSSRLEFEERRASGLPRNLGVVF